MALNWNIKNCDQSACWDKDTGCMTPLCEGLIWTTMVVDMGSITEDKLEEFVWRLNFMIRIGKSVVRKDREDTPYTLEEIRPFIGMSTNVATNTRKQFVKRTMDFLVQQHDRDQRARFREEASNVEA